MDTAAPLTKDDFPERFLDYTSEEAEDIVIPYIMELGKALKKCGSMYLFDLFIWFILFYFHCLIFYDFVIFFYFYFFFFFFLLVPAHRLAYQLDLVSRAHGLDCNFFSVSGGMNMYFFF